MGSITRRSVEDSLGVISFDEYIKFIEAVGNNNIVVLDDILATLSQKGIAIDTFIRGFGDFIVVALKAHAQTQRLLEEYSPQDVKQVRKITRNIKKDGLSEALLISRSYLNAESSFEYFAYAFRLTQVFNTDTPNSNESEISKRTTDVTSLVRRETQVINTDASTELTSDELMRMMQGGD